MLLRGGVAAAGRDADFKARLVLGAGRRAHVSASTSKTCACTVRPPLPLAAIAAVVAHRRSRSRPSGRRAPSAAFARRDRSAGPALDEILVAAGWRLPDCSDLRLGSAVVSRRGLELSWAARGRWRCPTTGRSGPPGIRAARRGAAALARGGAARTAARRHRAQAVGRLRARERRGRRGRGPPDLHRQRRGRSAGRDRPGGGWSSCTPAAGDPHAAARALIASADDPRTGASEAERAATLIAAAEILRKRLALPDDAGMLLERAIALDPSSIEALEALETLTTETGDFERLADVLERKLEVAARGPVEQQEILDAADPRSTGDRSRGPSAPGCSASGWR